MVRPRVLVVEPDPVHRAHVLRSLTQATREATAVGTKRETLLALAEGDVDVLLLALRLPDADGLDVLPEVLVTYPALPVIVMTAYSSIPSAVQAMRRGAVDYLPKPFSDDQLALALDKALEAHGLRREMARIRSEDAARHGVEAIVGASPSIRTLREHIRRVAESAATMILVRGETGTGKDLVAKALHYASPRAAGPFVAINCSAIPDSLLESELFGHERGAFTDARAQKRGLFEHAQGGTAFLDEVAELGPAVQAKLLRFLEDRTFRRVGGTRELEVDIRVIAATNADIERAAQAGKFREDLYYRLGVVPIDVPPLRERREDIPLLVHHFVDAFNKRFRKRFEGVAPEVFERLTAYAWPGNVRELRNVVERIMLLETGPLILPHMLRLSSGDRVLPTSGPGVRSEAAGEFTLARAELEAVLKALRHTEGNQSRAAQLLGMSRDSLRARVRRFGIRVETHVTASNPPPGSGPTAV